MSATSRRKGVNGENEAAKVWKAHGCDCRLLAVRRVRPWLPASTDLAYATASDDGLVTGVDSLDVGDGALAVPAIDPSEAT